MSFDIYGNALRPALQQIIFAPPYMTVGRATNG